ncbi:maltose ABC transporter substrate-binding protein [Halanaerobiaceae bacterium Z-7014]|uniref:Maltodextrin-binding protein n=1 Tax=Halonatronomonas betaini TaxID=2778430 RepID=A0A931F6T0_9FIRM|nr:maltose ABC transporter substrate-binding protein [Halonatronomonas betaini]MBF8435911.1 maltose ABC transporter substrate-binding protein [Halonatronomonas betaini]
MKKVIGLMLALVMVFGMANVVEASTPGQLLIWADDTRTPVLEDIKGEFEEMYGIPVEVQEKPFGDIRDDLAIEGPAGEGPDIIVGAHDWMGELVANGLIEPINLESPDLFMETGLDAFMWGEDLYGMPYAIEAIGLFYNKDIVEEPPATFEEFSEMVRNLRDRDEGKYGFVMPQPDPYHTFPFFSGYGGYVFGEDEDGVLNPMDIGLNNEGSIRALEELVELYDGYIPYIDYETMMSIFTSGDAGMMLTGPWAAADIRDAGIDYGFTSLPTMNGNDPRPFVGVQGFMISSFSENRILAQTFLNEFVATEDVMYRFYEIDDRPPTFIPAGDRASEDPDTAGVLESAETGVPMPAITEMAAVWSAWEDALSLALNQDQTAEEALNDAVDQIITTIEESE